MNPLTPAALVPDGGIGTKLIDTMHRDQPMVFTTVLGTFDVVTLSTGSVDVDHDHPASGYEFRSIWAQWSSPYTSADSPPFTAKAPSGMTWVIKRDGVTLASGVLRKTGGSSGSYVDTNDVTCTVSVHSPPVSGSGKGATIFMLIANKDVLWRLSMDTGKVLIS